MWLSRNPGSPTPFLHVAHDGQFLLDGELSSLLPSAAALPSGRYVVRAILDIGADHDIGAEREITLIRASTPNAPVR